MKTMPAYFVAALIFAVDWSAAVAAEQTVVLENARARITIEPAAGGKIVEYLDKESGLDYVSSHGIRDITAGINQVAHTVERSNGEGFQGAIARAAFEGIAVEREMRLADGSKELTVILTCRNVGASAKNVWIRWHTYMQFKDDLYAEHSVIVAPGPGGEIRRVGVGSGQDSQFWHVPGYWIAINYKSGNGIWMTFRKDDVPVSSTWTHYGWDKTPKRSEFTMEAFPRTVMLQPGEATQLQLTHQLFTATDALSRGLIAEEDVASSERFARLVRGNAEVIGRHTMVPTPRQASAVAQNRFNFHHRRRDRFALLDTGIMDAMFALAGQQSVPVRCRLFAQLFDTQFQYAGFHFRLTITDAVGQTVRQQTWSYGGAALDSRVFDMREDVAIDDLPDGRYTFAIEALTDLRKPPVHRYVRQGRLAGHARAAATAARQAKPLVERERPFVTALRTVDLPADGSVLIGFEEAGGIGRQAWPLRLGVPFAQGAVKSGDTFVVMDGLESRPTQTNVMGTWPDGSVRWLLVDFLSDIEANAHRFVSLKKAPAGTMPDLAQADAAGVRVDTGAARWTIQPDGVVAGLLNPSDIWWKTGEGTDYRFRTTNVAVIENGAVRALVRINGDYLAEGIPSPIARGEINLEFHRGKSFISLAHTFTYIGDPLANTLGSTGIAFNPTKKNWDRCVVDAGDQVLEHASSQSVYQIDEDFMQVSTPEGARHERMRSTGAAGLAGGDGRLVVFHRDFWRLFPSRVDVSVPDSKITFHYWPPNAGAMSWLPREGGLISSSSSPQALARGVSRTHRFVIDPSGAFTPQQYEAAYNEPIACLTPPRYLAGTRTLMHLQPYNPAVAPELESFMADAMESYIIHQQTYNWYGQWRWGALDNRFDDDREAWSEYGRYANLMNEQDIVHMPWLVYLRSGNRDYLKLALANTYHLLEVGTIRENPHDPAQAGMSRRHHECAWLSPGDYGHSMLDPFLELYHATGDRAGWDAANRMAAGMARTTTGNWRYLSNPVTGLSRMYLETGNAEYKREADRLWTDLCAPDRNEWFDGDHGSRMALLYSQLNPDCKRLWREMTDAKKAFHTLDTLSALWEETGDAQYARRAAAQFHDRVKRCQTYDPERKDPMFWAAAMHTQHVLAALREMVYASKAVEAGDRLPAEK